MASALLYKKERALVFCGKCLFWFPRAAVPLIIVWGTISHVVYCGELTNIIAKVILGTTGLLAGVLGVISYFQVWIQGPGSPLEFPEFVCGDDEMSAGSDRVPPEVLNDAVEAKYDGTVRFCKRCNVFKPDRSHHCRQCGVCVLRMDHHCPWFSTCVGLRNHKYFIQLMWYVWILCVCCDFVGVPMLYRFIKEETYNTVRIRANLVFYTIIATMFVLIISVFGTYSTNLVVENRTTLESMEAVPYRTSLPSVEWRYRHPPTMTTLGNLYDMGYRENIEQLFGRTWIELLLPIRSRLRYDGRFFPYNNDLREIAEQRAQTEIEMHRRKRMHQLESSN